MGRNPATAELIQIRGSQESLACHFEYGHIPANLASLTRTSSTDDQAEKAGPRTAVESRQNEED
jgi:hypothetical protein